MVHKVVGNLNKKLCYTNFKTYHKAVVFHTVHLDIQALELDMMLLYLRLVKLNFQVEVAVLF